MAHPVSQYMGVTPPPPPRERNVISKIQNYDETILPSLPNVFIQTDG